MSATSSSAPAPWPLAWRLALGQLIAWGTLYYAFTVVVAPMERATGWSRPFLNLGVSLGLLVWGLCAYPVGVWIHQRGARGLMASASVIGGAALALIGLTNSPAAYLNAWTLLGMAMSGVLYEPAFAVVTEHFGARYRRGITVVTLVGGLASTVFIPLVQSAVTQVGWRETLIVLGAGQALVGAALHWFCVPKRLALAALKPSAELSRSINVWSIRNEWCDPRFRGLALWFAAHAATFSGTILLLVPVLQAASVPSSTILNAVVLIGPMQVAGRFALTIWGEHVSTLHVGRWATSILVLSLVPLSFTSPTLGTLILFAVLYGAANGVMTIVRGTVSPNCSVGNVTPYSTGRCRCRRFSPRRLLRWSSRQFGMRRIHLVPFSRLD